MPAPDLLTTDDDLIPPFEPVSEEDAAFAEYYEREVRPLFASLSSERKEVFAKHRRRMAVILPVCLILFVSYVLYANWFVHLRVTDDLYYPWIMIQGYGLPIVVAIAGASVFYTYLPLRAYEKKAHATVFPKILAFFGDLHHQRDPSPDWNTIKKTGVVWVGGDNIAHDRIRGTYKGAEIDIMELHTKIDRKHGDTLFRGLFVSIAFPRQFHGKTLINPERGQGRVYAEAGGMETVDLEDPDFEREFEVYSTDQVEARYLLTPDFMTKVLHLAAVFRHDGAKGVSALYKDLLRAIKRPRTLKLSFLDDRLNIAIPSMHDRFEPAATGRIQDDYAAALVLYREVKDVLAIIDLLDLQHRDKA